MAKSSTPLMKQYLSIKGEHPDEILLFRLGDFYETFFDDAKKASRALDIALTSRNSRDGEAAVPLAGFPAHAADSYISRLLRAGHRVAVCEQVEDPKTAKGLVKREVVEVLSTGTTIAEGILEEGRNNYLMVAAPADAPALWGLAMADVSTGEFLVTEVPAGSVRDEMERFAPSEVVLPDDWEEERLIRGNGGTSRSITRLEGFRFGRAAAEQTLKEHFGTTSLKGFGLDALDRGTCAAGALIAYLKESRMASLGHLRHVRIRQMGEGMLLDAATQRNLELVANLRDGGRAGTLLEAVDGSRTAMGARTLRMALLRPLTGLGPIEARLESVAVLVEEPDLRAGLAEVLDGVGDLERLAVRVETRKASPRDLVALRTVQHAVPGLIRLLAGLDAGLLSELAALLDPLEELTTILSEALEDDPPLTVSEGGIVRAGYDEELDRLRVLSASGKSWIADLQRSERERTGIPTLKVGFNKVFGYYLEVTKTHTDKVPDDYLRKQTLVAAERYITPELKEKEEEVLNAQERAWTREQRIFEELRDQTAGHLEALQANAAAIGRTDMLAGLAEAAVRHGFVRPEMAEGGPLLIEDGRHPVVEALLAQATFIPNDTLLDRDRSVAIVTGPNMAGKSTYLRQVGLICLLAQTGSFVPAAKARLPVLDRIFTRVGAMDNLAGGESTFLVEMHETANILHNATADSLVLLDEIGRGTSTYDGLSIAWAVAEYLHDAVGARTIFATHYHELTVLADRLPGVFNLNVAVKEWGDRVVFMHKIVPGGCDHSYGIHVAELAGVPQPVLERSRRILLNLEEDRPLPAGERVSEAVGESQIELFARRPDPLVERLKNVDPDQMTPMEALALLEELKRLL